MHERNIFALRREAASARGRRMAMARWSADRQAGEVDSDTMRLRALHDRKGAHYATISTNGLVFELFWSVNGRVDQVDVFLSGKHMLTSRPSICLEWCRERACFSQDAMAL